MHRIRTLNVSFDPSVATDCEDKTVTLVPRSSMWWRICPTFVHNQWTGSSCCKSSSTPRSQTNTKTQRLPRFEACRNFRFQLHTDLGGEPLKGRWDSPSPHRLQTTVKTKEPSLLRDHRCDEEDVEHLSIINEQDQNVESFLRSIGYKQPWRRNSHLYLEVTNTMKKMSNICT